MKFKNSLYEGVFLKRHFRFLVEIALLDKKRRMLYCPNLKSLEGSLILGSRLWFSKTPRLSQGYLDVLELIEVDRGEKVLINPEYAFQMLRESIHQNKITELYNFKFLYQHVGNSIHTMELLIKENGDQCFMTISPVFIRNETGIGILKSDEQESISILQELILQKKMGHRAMLIYCAQHSGIQSIRPIDRSDSLYAKYLLQALEQGVEILGYRLDISLDKVELGSRLPVCFSENSLSL